VLEAAGLVVLALACAAAVFGRLLTRRRWR